METNGLWLTKGLWLMKLNRAPTTLGLDRYSGVYIWALFIAIFGLWKPALFLSMSTVHSIASQQSISAMLAIAVLIPLLCGAYDLSVGATVNLSAITVAWLQVTHHWSMWPSIGVTVLAIAIIGVINGFIVVKLRVNSFIATLGTATIVTAVQGIVSGEVQPLPVLSQSWNMLTQRHIFGFQIVFLYLIVMVLITWWVLDFTPVGRYFSAIGGNAEAARLAGVQVGKWTWLSLVASATISGIAGVLYSSLSGPSLTFGSSLLLPAFAAAFLGSTQIKPSRFNIWGTMLAVFVLATGIAGLQLVTGVQWLGDMFNGVALVSAVSFAVWRQRTSGNRRRVSGERGADSEPPIVGPDGRPLDVHQPAPKA